MYIINSARMITVYPHWKKKQQPMSEQECPQPGGRVTDAVTELIFKYSSECLLGWKTVMLRGNWT